MSVAGDAEDADSIRSAILASEWKKQSKRRIAKEQCSRRTLKKNDQQKEVTEIRS
jgi:hypothetical protein